MLRRLLCWLDLHAPGWELVGNSWDMTYIQVCRYCRREI